MSQDHSTALFTPPTPSSSRHHLSYPSFCIFCTMATRGTRNNKPYNVCLSLFSLQHSSRFSHYSDLHVPDAPKATGCTTRLQARLPLAPALPRLFLTFLTRSSSSQTCIMK